MQRSSDIQVIDDTGTLLTLLKPAKRIVSLTATGLDILFELGLYLASRSVLAQWYWYSNTAPDPRSTVTQNLSKFKIKPCLIPIVA